MANKRGAKSGLYRVAEWWQPIKPPDPTAQEIGEIRKRKTTLTAAQTAFSVDHLGALVVEHEAYCAAERVSPGVRWGLWQLAYTANRRFSTMGLRRDRLFQSDEFGGPGLGAVRPGRRRA